MQELKTGGGLSVVLILSPEAERRAAFIGMDTFW